MPAANKRNVRVIQDRPDVNWGKFERIIQKLNTGNACTDGEKLATLDILTNFLEKGGRRWEDLAIACEAARFLADALAASEQRVADLEVEQSRGTNLALWNDVGAKITNTRTSAAWALDLHRRGLIYLAPKDIEFLSKTIPRWVGPLRPRQQAYLQGILDRAVNSTGQIPPV